MKHQFSEGDIITLAISYPTLGLEIGAQGRVWTLYTTDLPSYEATFCGADGEEFDLTVSEDEIFAKSATDVAALSAAA